jgi:hypothetical protein
MPTMREGDWAATLPALRRSRLAQAYGLCCKKSPPRSNLRHPSKFVLTGGCRQPCSEDCVDITMLADIADIVFILSIAILVAHAFDAFRSS